MAKRQHPTSPSQGAKAATPELPAEKVPVVETPVAEPVRAETPEAQPSETETVAVKRRKPEALRKEVQLHIRITEGQREAFVQAAAREGHELSAWVRATLLKAAGVTPK